MSKETQSEIEKVFQSVQFANPDIVRRHIIEALDSSVASLVLKVSENFRENGQLTNMLRLHGTVACNYRGNTYNIPIDIYFSQHYPNVSPLTYVRPTSDMYISTTCKSVLPDGKLVIPYTRNWNHQNSIIGLLNEMSQVFSMSPPVYAKNNVVSSTTKYVSSYEPPPPPSLIKSSLSTSQVQELTGHTTKYTSSYEPPPPPSLIKSSLSTSQVQELTGHDSVQDTHLLSSSSTASASNINEQSHVHRFSDLAGEPLNILLPIQGYEKLPVVPLEEAIVPLQSIVEDIEQMVWIAKQKCIHPKDGLTCDESASIMLYTMEWEPCNKSFYVLLNEALRAARRDHLKAWFLYLRLVIYSLQKLRANDRITVYRGVNGNLSNEYRRGETIVWWGFSSCTRSIETLNNKNFLGKTGARTFFSIECESGMNIRSHSFYEDEDEILLLPARQFEVVGCIDQGNGLKLVQLRETKPKFPLIKLP